jgi:hypothetical protein
MTVARPGLCYVGVTHQCFADCGFGLISTASSRGLISWRSPVKGRNTTGLSSSAEQYLKFESTSLRQLVSTAENLCCCRPGKRENPRVFARSVAFKNRSEFASVDYQPPIRLIKNATEPNTRF